MNRSRASLPPGRDRGSSAPTSKAFSVNAGTPSCGVAEAVEGPARESVAVTSVVARSLADALQGLFQNPPRRRGSAGRPAVDAAGWVGAATLGRRPMLKAAWTRVPRASEVQNHSPRIPHGKVTKWQSISISPCQEAIIG